jgi:serine-aspartate repeat-containing protein C/D/E
VSPLTVPRPAAGFLPFPITRVFALAALATALIALALGPVGTGTAWAAPLSGSSYDSGDGNEDNAAALDWQSAQASGRVTTTADYNAADDCFIGGNKEDTPDDWEFDSSAGGCTPGKSNILGAWVNPESVTSTSFVHMAFKRDDTTGNTFLTFELNQSAVTWVNSAGTTIPCRSNGDLLLSYEVGGSSIAILVYKWIGDGTGPLACPNGANGSFVGSGAVPVTAAQGSMNAGAITNYLSTASLGASFPANSFGEGAVDIPAVMAALGENPCVGFVQVQVHSRSSSSISSALIDNVRPVPAYVQSCAATGTAFADNNGNGTKDAGEPGVAGHTFYIDVNGNSVKDPSEPSAVSGSDGTYRILNVPAGNYAIREVPIVGWTCTTPASCSYNRIFAGYGNSTGNDFGGYQAASASGTVFHDLDADGVRDAGENGLPGRTVYADLDDDGELDPGEPEATTNAAGVWAIGALSPGNYVVRQLTPADWECSSPSGCSYSVSLNSGQALTGRDFGIFTTGSISGVAFHDVDLDGTQSAEEVGLEGRTVYADLDGDGELDPGEPETLTGPDGSWTLDGLDPGDYVVRQVLPPNWSCSSPVGCTFNVSLASDEAVTVSGGFANVDVTPASASGTVFEDSNADGNRDLGEDGVAGRTVFADLDDGGELDPGEPQATTDADGAWSLTGLLPDNYVIRLLSEPGWSCSAPADCRQPLTLGAGDSAPGTDFGTYQAASTSGTVFHDLNADGDRDAGDVGLVAMTVWADLDDDGEVDPSEPETTTDSDGAWSISDLAPGDYVIRLLPDVGWECSVPTDCGDALTLSSGESASGTDFGTFRPASISGVVFNDVDADGDQGPGEDGLADRTVFVDLDDDGELDPGEPETTTDADGNWTIDGLAPGDYVVRELPPSGWTCSAPPTCTHPVTLSSNEDATLTGGFANVDITPATLSGTVFHDLNGDGTRDPGEDGLAGKAVYLDLDDNGNLDSGEPSTTTAADGSWSITGILPGDYVLRELAGNGWKCSTPTDCGTAVTLAPGEDGGQDFANFMPVTITGTRFVDTNGNGVQDPGEPGLSGWTVFLDLDGDGELDPDEPSAVTDEDGNFSIPEIDPGTYTLRLIPQDGFTCSDATPCDAVLTITSGPSSPHQTFSSRAPSTAPAPQPQAPAPAAPAKPAPKKARTCTSRRTILIHVPHRIGPVKHVTVKAGGRKMKVIYGKRRTKAIIDLRGLTKERYTIRLRIVTPDGRVLHRKRRFWTCTPRNARPRSQSVHISF